MKKFTKAKSLAKRYGWVCRYCRGQLTENNWTLDHVKPLSKHGSNRLDNLVLACSFCNNKKGNKDWGIKTFEMLNWPPYLKEF